MHTASRDHDHDLPSHGDGPPRPRRRPVTRWLRMSVPAAGGILLAIIVLWPLLRQQEPGFTLSFSATAEFDDRLRMQDLRFEGTDSRSRPFVVTADSAYRETADTGPVHMTGVTANVTLENGLWLNLEAGRGIFRDTEERLSLDGAVDLYSSAGYEIHGSDMTVDLADAQAFSRAPVSGQGPLGAFRADGFESDLAVRNLILKDDVVMTVRPRSPRSPRSEDKES